MIQTTISKTGQIVLPPPMLRKLGIDEHTRLTVECSQSGILIRPVSGFMRLSGFLGRALPPEVEQKHIERMAYARQRKKK